MGLDIMDELGSGDGNKDIVGTRGEERDVVAVVGLPGVSKCWNERHLGGGDVVDALSH